jgi:cell division protease FtsH
VKKFVHDAYHSAYGILDAHHDIMHRMSVTLLERETLDAEEIRLIIAGEELPPARSSLAFADPGPGDTQKVLKPESGRSPGFGEGRPSPA